MLGSKGAVLKTEGLTKGWCRALRPPPPQSQFWLQDAGTCLALSRQEIRELLGQKPTSLCGRPNGDSFRSSHINRATR